MDTVMIQIKMSTVQPVVIVVGQAKTLAGRVGRLEIRQGFDCASPLALWPGTP